MSALNQEGENAVKVAYVICKDRKRSGRECTLRPLMSLSNVLTFAMDLSSGCHRGGR